MKKRNIPFGYEIKNGEIAIVPTSAKVVMGIYIDYLNGKSFLNIADELTAKQVDYYEGKTTWNKLMIKRILECRFYIGDEKYPPIIEEERFKAVAKLIASKYGGYNKDPRATILKKRTFCQECGERIWRDIQSARYHAWKCKRCSQVKIREHTFYEGITEILNSVIEHPELLDEIESTQTYESEYELTEKNKTLTEMLSSPKVEFDTAFESILALASDKYDNCEYDLTEELTETIKADFKGKKALKDVDIELLERTVSHVTVDSQDKIAIHFINGAVVRTKGETE